MSAGDGAGRNAQPSADDVLGEVIMHRRNTEGLKAAALRKRDAALLKATAAIDQLLSENRAVNFESVSEQAGVTRTWLYKSELRARIEQLRVDSRNNPPLPPQHRASEASLLAMLRTVRNENKRLRAEIEALQQQQVSVSEVQIVSGLCQLQPGLPREQGLHREHENHIAWLCQRRENARSQVENLKAALAEAESGLAYYNHVLEVHLGYSTTHSRSATVK